MKLLTLGPEGSNAHVAALEFAKKIGLSEIHFTRPNYSIVETVAKNYDSYIGLVPFETTSGALVPEVVEAIDDYRPKFCGEYILPVRHCLAWKQGRVEDVKLIISHKQALRQCSKYLRSNYPTIEQQSVDSTSLAAEMASKDEKLAAICTKLAVDIYGLTNIIEDIQDSDRNRTRLIAISNKDSENATGNDRTTLRYEVMNKSAALWNVIGTFSKRGLNLSGQHSIPTGNSLGEYYQITEVEAHKSKSEMQKALEELEQLIIKGSLFIYGSYPRHKA